MREVGQTELAAVLRLTREMAGLTERYMAHHCGCSQGYVSMIESAQREPSLKLLRAWARATGHEALVSLVGGAYIGHQSEREIVELITKSVRYEMAFSLATDGKIAQAAT